MTERLLHEESHQRGFTMLELLIAMVVLSVGLVSVVTISAYVSRSNTISNNVSVLAASAQSQVDVLRSAIWTNTSEDPALAVGGSLTSNVTNHYVTQTNTAAGNLTVRWQVRQGGTADMRYITVKVVQENALPFMKEGISVTTIIFRN